MKTLRAWIVFVLLITLPLITSPVITLATPNHQDKALILSSLSLLKGGANGFELERQPTRAEGAVMLVRLLGQENQARQQNYRHPFRDVPAWASPYIGYMYQFSLTQGSSPSTFSPGEPLSAQAYTTFVLRALGYNDQAGDFDYNASLEKASQLGMLSAQQAAAIAAHTFIRDDMVNISYLTLTMNLKNQDKTLIEKLVYEDRAVSEASAQRNGLIDPGQEVFSQTSFANTASPDDNNQYNVSSSRDLQAALELAMLNLQPQITLGFTNYPGDPLEDFETVIDRTQSAIENNTGLINLISEWRYEGNAQRLKVSFAYRYTWTQLVQLNQQGDKLIESLLNETFA